MGTEIQTVQDIPIELQPFSVAPYGDRFVVKNRATMTYVFIDDEELGWMDELKTPTSMSNLIQVYHRQTGKYSYKKVFEFVALILSAGLLTPKSQAALTSTELFSLFSPPELPKVIAPFSLSARGPLGRFIAKIADSWTAIALLAFLAGYETYRMFTHMDEFPWLMIRGKFSLGLLVWIFSFASIIFLKSMFKSLMLTGKGLDVTGSGFRMMGGMPKYAVKDSDILTLGPDSTLRFHLAALLFPAALSFAGLMVFRLAHSTFWGIWSLACLLVIFIDLSPFVQREFMNAMDRMSGKNRLLETLKNFAHRKYVGLYIWFGHTYKVEARLFGYAIYFYSVLWLFCAYLMSSSILARNMESLTRAVLLSPSIVERAAAIVLSLGLLFPFIGIVAGVIRFVALNLYTLFEKPINRALNRVARLFHQFHDLPKTDIMRFLNGIPLFAQLTPEMLSELTDCMTVQYFQPNRTVVWQGKPGDAFYVIYSGEAHVIREEPNGDRTLLAMLSERDSFGEIALIRDEPRGATVKAQTGLTCLVLQKKFFKEIVAPSLKDKDHITRLIQWNAVLKGLPIFSDLPAETMARVILEMTERTVAAGETIVQEGAAAKEFYILRSGSVAVWKNHGRPDAKQIATLKSVACFGEIALFEDSPRTASVVAVDPCQILVMTKAAFFKILRSSVLSGIWVEQIAKVRRQELMARS